MRPPRFGLVQGLDQRLVRTGRGSTFEPERALVSPPEPRPRSGRQFFASARLIDVRGLWNSQ